ncbi:hypothetical protein CR513_61409, partial [Mucuna pruriens]
MLKWVEVVNWIKSILQKTRIDWSLKLEILSENIALRLTRLRKTMSPTCRTGELGILGNQISNLRQIGKKRKLQLSELHVYETVRLDKERTKR